MSQRWVLFRKAMRKCTITDDKIHICASPHFVLNPRKKWNLRSSFPCGQVSYGEITKDQVRKLLSVTKYQKKKHYRLALKPDGNFGIVRGRIQWKKSRRFAYLVEFPGNEFETMNWLHQCHYISNAKPFMQVDFFNNVNGSRINLLLHDKEGLLIVRDKGHPSRCKFVRIIRNGFQESLDKNERFQRMIRYENDQVKSQVEQLLFIASDMKMIELQS